MLDLTTTTPFGQARRDFSVILVADAGEAADAAEAVALAGGRLLSTIGWTDVATGLSRHASRPLFVVETRGVPDALLATELARIDAAAAALECRVVVTLDEGQIDRVTAGFVSARADFLCQPDMTERVSAIAIAAEFMGLSLLGDTLREGEAARLRRLNEEVARITEVLARLTSRQDQPVDSPLRQFEDRRASFGVAPPTEEIIDPNDIRRVIRSRRLREQFLGKGLFEDPAWDMMLDLFAAELENVQVSVSSLCIAAAVAPTTALRWIGKMTEAGLFVRHPDPFDRRRAFMALAPEAVDGMRRYVSAVRRAGLGVA